MGKKLLRYLQNCTWIARKPTRPLPRTQQRKISLRSTTKCVSEGSKCATDPSTLKVRTESQCLYARRAHRYHYCLVFFKLPTDAHLCPIFSTFGFPPKFHTNSWFATQGVPKNEFSCGNQIWKRVWKLVELVDPARNLAGRLCWVVQFQNRPLLKMYQARPLAW
jgi:hypothetical protein